LYTCHLKNLAMCALCKMVSPLIFHAIFKWFKLNLRLFYGFQYKRANRNGTSFFCRFIYLFMSVTFDPRPGGLEFFLSVAENFPVDSYTDKEIGKPTEELVQRL
jgi:hypothetical protein